MKTQHPHYIAGTKFDLILAEMNETATSVALLTYKI